MAYQSVSIDVYDEFGHNNLGRLKIKSKDVYKEFRSFEEDGVKYDNVEQVKILDDETPIQYFINEEEKNLSKLVLLEETEYKLIFEPINDISQVVILPTIQNNKAFLLDPWSEEDLPYRAYLNFRSYVGKSFFDVEMDGTKSKKYPFEVRSKKMGYYQQYDAMITDLAMVASGMIFEQDAPLFSIFDFYDKKRKTPYEDYMFIEYLFQPENLPLGYEYILKNLHYKLEKFSENVPTSFASNIGPSKLIEIVSNPDCLCKSTNQPPNWPAHMKGYVPESINQDYYEDSIDTPENRLLKYFLESVEKMIFDILSEADDGLIKDKLRYYFEMVQNYLSDRWLQDVGNLEYIPLNSQVMQKKEGYRDIFKFYLYFEFAFRLNWEDIEEDLKGYEKKLSELYEYWCYVKLLKVLSDFTGQKIKFEDIYNINYHEWAINLKKGRKNAQRFVLNRKGEQFTVDLIYNGRFSRSTKIKSYSVPLKPDYALNIKYKEEEYIIHFDAKYRSQKKFLKFFEKINTTDSKEELEELELREKNEEIYRQYQLGDLYKMHTYKDAISNSLGAYILYPGDTAAIFDEYQTTKAEFKPSVGAFPLTPGGYITEEESQITTFIKNILDFILVKPRMKP